MTKASFSTEQIQFLHCGIVSFHAQNNDELPIRPADIEGHTFQFSSEMGTAEGNLLRVLIKVECKAQPKDANSKPLEGKITTECIFRVKDLDQMLTDKTGTGIPENIALTTISIAYSTTRGLLSAKASGTFLEGAVLPIVQPAKLLAVE